jgi:hypothetical protein
MELSTFLLCLGFGVFLDDLSLTLLVELLYALSSHVS